MRAHLAVSCARIEGDGEVDSLAHQLDILALLTLLRGVLLEHARAHLPRHHLLLAVAPAPALGWPQHTLVTHQLLPPNPTHSHWLAGLVQCY